MKYPKQTLTSLKTAPSVQSVQSRKISLLTNGGRATGIATCNAIAERLIGEKIWNINDYGQQISTLNQEKIDKLDFCILTKNDTSMNVVIFNQAFIDQHWQTIQLTFPKDAVAMIATAFEKQMFPHLELETGNFEFIRYNGNTTLPHIPYSTISNSRNYEEVAKELENYGSAIALTQKFKSTQTKITQVKATLLSTKHLKSFEESGVKIVIRSPNDYFSKGNVSIASNEILRIKGIKWNNSPDLMIIAPPNADESINNILSSLKRTVPKVELTSLRPPSIEEQRDTPLKNMQIGAIIAAHILEAESRNRTIGSWITTPKKAMKYLAVTTNLHTINTLQKLPLGEITTPLTAGKNSLFRYADSNRHWFQDHSIQHTVFDHASSKRENFQKQASRNLAMIFDNTNSYVLLDDMDDGRQCLITASETIAQAMYTIESKPKVS